MMPPNDRQSNRASFRERRSACPLACTLDLVGDRWTLLLVRDLIRGKRRYGELLDSWEKIPTNILADRLKRLEQADLISAIPYSSRPLRFEYHLTPKGRALGHAVEALGAWGLKHLPGTQLADWPGLEPE